jgi:hypothetical protein
MSINKAQTLWYQETSKLLNVKNQTPALLFTHVPLIEYFKGALQEGICGGMNEMVSFEPINSGLFDIMKAENEVKGVFVGHDHCNDFCTLYQGIQLCYEGSPGYQAYGQCDPLGRCHERRARVTKIKHDGQQTIISSWKRTESNQVIDHEVLWSSDGLYVSTESNVGRDHQSDKDCVRVAWNATGVQTHGNGTCLIGTWCGSLANDEAYEEYLCS